MRNQYDRAEIRSLPDRVATFIRASHVIGSLPRAIEELVHNSILHGYSKSVVVTLGKSDDIDSMSEISVSDDGIGIDCDAMRMFIGTEFCSRDVMNHSVKSPDLERRGKDLSGESLKSIAALCVEMKIETSSIQLDNDIKTKGNPQRDAVILTSTKVIRDGVVSSFDDSLNKGLILQGVLFGPSLGTQMSSKPTTGTKVTVRGLFYQHLVRRKHDLITQQKTAVIGTTKTSYQQNQQWQVTSISTNLSQIQNTIRLLALCYPLVTIKLRNEMSNFECGYAAPYWAMFLKGPMSCRFSSSVKVSSASLMEESQALKSRFCEIYALEATSKNFTVLAYEEDQSPSTFLSKKSQVTLGEMYAFRAFGAMHIPEGSESIIPHNKDLGIIAINGRPAYHAKKFVGFLANQIKHYIGKKCVFCNNIDCQLVMEGNTATVSILDNQRFEAFLKALVANMADSLPFTKDEPVVTIFDDSLHFQSTKILKGKPAHSTLTKSAEPLLQEKSASPFSQTFFDHPSSVICAAEEKMNVVYFEDAFFVSSPRRNILNEEKKHQVRTDDEEIASTMWTKKRVRTLEKNISTLNPDSKIGLNYGSIYLTKEMLTTAEVIAQIEKKFIIIKTCGKICVVDQHAADERVALERLEKALFSPNLHDQAMIKMSKKDILVKDILKQKKVIPSQCVRLTVSQIATIRHHHALLHRWYFLFEEPSMTDRSLILTGLPSICGKIPHINDFIGFVQELSHQTDSNIIPGFVKRIIASQACRYAIMFGDALSLEECCELIRNLAKCESAFICAHGRPSVIPLIDINESGRSRSIWNAFQNKSTKSKEGTLKSGPKRLIRQKCDSD